MDLQRLAGQVLSVVVSDTPPDGDMPAGWLWEGLHWFNTADGKWRKWDGSSWYTVHSPFNNINLTGTITTDDDAGVSGEFNSDNQRIKKMKVKNGIIIELEVEDLD